MTNQDRHMTNQAGQLPEEVLLVQRRNVAIAQKCEFQYLIYLSNLLMFQCTSMCCGATINALLQILSGITS